MSRLITATTATDPGLGLLLRNLWRPRLVVSDGHPTIRMHPDATLDSDWGELDDLTSTLVASMRDRVVRTFKLQATCSR